MNDSILVTIEFDNLRKEVNLMQSKFEAPELTLIGEADEVVMGGGGSGPDLPFMLEWDFEFEQD